MRKPPVSFLQECIRNKILTSRVADIEWTIMDFTKNSFLSLPCYCIFMLAAQLVKPSLLMLFMFFICFVSLLVET